MAEIVKVGMLGIIGVLLAVQLKGQKPEYGTYVGFALSILIFCYALKRAGAVMGQISLLKSYLGGGEGYLSTLLKVVGITYVCEFCAGICKDGGFTAVADQIEILGKLSVLFAGLPILFAVIGQIREFGM